MLSTIGTNLQNWINAGGIYIGSNNGGTNTARLLRTTTLNTASIPGLLTPGSTFDARSTWQPGRLGL